MKIDNTYLYLIWKTWKYAWEKRKIFVFHILSAIIANSWLLATPYFFWQAINILQEWWDNMMYNFWLELLFMFFSFFVHLIFHHFFVRKFDAEVWFFCNKNFKVDLYEKISKMPMDRIQDNHSWKIIDNINRWWLAINSFLKDFNFHMIRIFFKIFGSIFITFIIFPYIWFFALFLWFLVILISFKFDKKVIWYYKQKVKKEQNVASILHDYITNIVTIITLRLEELTKSEIIKNIDLIFNIHKKEVFTRELKWFLNSFLSIVIRLLILFVYCYYSLDKNWTIIIWTLMMIWEYTKEIDSWLSSLNLNYSRIIKCRADFEIAEKICFDYEKFLNFNRELKSIKIKNWKKIEIKNLYYNYKSKKDKKDFRIENINLVLEKWKKIAFIWESWSWKSTIMKLLRWIYDPISFEVFVDGKKFKNTWISNITTLFPQEPDIFENTIKYNVTAWIKSRKKEILKYISLSWFKKVFDKLSDWLETNIKEKWVNFSGWEKQRLAIARWLFAAKNSEILLLDEPTSSVDPKNEKEIYENIFQENKNKCIISSIHKHYLLKSFDYIYVFDKWKIIKEWTFEQIKKD